MSFSGLVIGLGNPGGKYGQTRHNLGFMVLEEVLDRAKAERDLAKLKQTDDYILWAVGFTGSRWLAVMPLTYMNRSGRAVGVVCRYYGIEPANMLVIHDELDLSAGRIKFKRGGGTAGHRGLNSIVDEMGTTDFDRLRVGIGRPPQGFEASAWVLSKIPESEADLFKHAVSRAASWVALYCTEGFAAAADAANVSASPES